MPRKKIQKRLFANSWSPQEDTVLTHFIVLAEEKGEAVNQAYKAAAARINRTAGACAWHWRYVVLPKIEAGKWEKKKLDAVPEAVKEVPVATRQMPDLDKLSVGELKEAAADGYILRKLKVHNRKAYDLIVSMIS